MTITYDWKFSEFDVALSEYGLQNVVKGFNWRLVGTDEDGVSAEIFNYLSLGEPTLETFVPFDLITEQWAIDNVTYLVDINAGKQQIEHEIYNKKNPPTVKMLPPFLE